MTDPVDEYRDRLRVAMDRMTRLRATLEAERRARSEPIAIIGIGGRFPPDEADPDRFFARQLAGQDATSEPSPERHGPEYATFRRGGYLRDVRGFDAAFFGLAPREAAAMDPQQRLLLEATWEALERAGQAPAQLVGRRVGCFVGLTAADYLGLALGHGPAGRDIYTLTGNGHCFAAGRLAFTFGFQGPCMTVDTACSSSLVAVHLAVRSLRDGESALAVAAGVHLVLASTSAVLLAGSGALAPDGRCKAFDAAADGFTRGEGCGVLVLKRLSDARRDHDPILALIRGSATNQDGRSAGFTAPSAPAQAAMLRQALADAGLSPGDIGLLETHGTGTALGDPIELQALADVFGGPRPEPLILGALKSHIGHLEAAAGIAGLIKAIACLRAGQVPPNLHFARLNPHADLGDARFLFPTTVTTWPKGQAPRRAGVSSFGMSGSNAHIILEEAPDDLDDAPSPPPPHLLVLSARTLPALQTLARRTAPALATAASTATAASPATATSAAAAASPATTTSTATAASPATATSTAAAPATTTATATATSTGTASLADFARTAARRNHFAHRLALLASSAEEAARDLLAFADGDPPASLVHGLAEGPTQPVFVLSGQGSAWPGMGQGLRDEPAARDLLDAMEPLVARHGGFSLRAALEDPAAPLHDTAVAQPAIVGLALALAAVLRSWGVAPAALVGHSVGEIAAAHLAGALSLDEALHLACVRGRVMQHAAGKGGMLAAEIDPDTAHSLLARHGERAALAAINAPRSVVLAGEPEVLDLLLADLQAQGARARRLRVDFAFHSPQMTPLQPELRAALGPLAPQRTALRLYSTVTGEAALGPDLDAEHWIRGIREPVRMARALALALAEGHRVFLELGPHPVLLADIRACARDVAGCTVAPTLWRDHHARTDLLRALAELFVAGAPADLTRLDPLGHRLAPLPTYPWQRRDHWLSPVPSDLSRGPPDLSQAPSDLSQAPASPDLSQAPSDLSQAPPSDAHADLSQAPAAPPAPPPLLVAARSSGPAARRSLLARVVRDELGAVLGLPADEPVSVRQGLFELGMDSMMAVELRGRLERRLDLALSPTLVFDHPTLDALALHLAGLLGPTVAATRPPAADEHAVAIVGMACRFPGGANDPDAYWELLRVAGDGIVEVPPDRWDGDAYFDPDPGAAGKTYARRCGFLSGLDVAEFDAAFFRISPLEAKSLDPQQRILLELTWEALEDAGLAPDALEGSRTGVYIGIATTDYGQLAGRVPLAALDPYLGVGASPNTAAGRISHILGLRGPALALDTACSSSLVAAHLACQSLRRGETDLALVGGVNLMLLPGIQVAYARMGVLAPDSRCKAFDAAADGMVRGEGGGLVVLRRLADARRDGDRVLAVIRGSAVNHDGRSAGLTVPSGTAQRLVVREALADAGLAPCDVDFVEAHGTGTTLGDPIEANALIAELGPGRPPERPLHLGAAKALVGHLEAAAGMVGLIKTVLAVRHGVIPPQRNFQRLNPAIVPGPVPLVIPTETALWPPGPRIAGVSSFGMSGTNAHLILTADEPAPQPASNTLPTSNTLPSPAPRGLLLPISARDPAALRALAGAYRVHLADPTCPVDLLCAAAARRRAHLEQRLALTGVAREDLLAALDAHLRDELHPGWALTRAGDARPRLAFVFSGHSGHWVGMGRELLASEPAFGDALRACDRALAAHRPGSLIDDLLAADAAPRWASAEVLQPLVLGIQLALAELWSHWGVTPQAVVGHSMGEIAAACVAGALDPEDAFRICVHRSRLVERLRGRGAMASVAIPLEQLREHLAPFADRIGVAAANSPILTVLSGEPDALRALADRLTRQNIFVRPVRDATAAGHSPQLDPLLPELRAALADLRPRPTTLPLYSTVTAGEIAGSDLGADYWARNLRAPVLFTQTLQAMGAAGLDTFLEVSPSPLLLGAIEQTLRPRGGAIARLGSLKMNAPERPALLASLARLYVLGLDPDWSQLAPQCPHLPLPVYPWQRRRHWTDAPPFTDLTAAPASPTPGAHPLLPRPVHHARRREHLWDLTLDPACAAALGLSQVQGLPVLPTACLLELVLAAVDPLSSGTSLTDLSLGPALVVDVPLDLQLVITDPDPVGAHFELLTRRPGEDWTLAAAGRLTRPVPTDTAPVPADIPTLANLRARCGRAQDDLRARLGARGLELSPAMWALREVWIAPSAPREALARIQAAATPGRACSPAALESGLQLLAALVHGPDDPPVDGELFAARALEELTLLAPGAEIGWVHAALREPAGPSFGATGDLRFHDPEGRLVALLRGVDVGPPDRDLARRALFARLDTWLHAIRWQPGAPADPRPEAPGVWLILPDAGGLAERLAARLAARGERPRLVRPDELTAALGDARARGPLRAVLHLRGLDPAPDDDGLPEHIAAEGLVLLQLAQTLARDGLPGRIVLLTRGAEPATGGPQDLAGGPLWGLARTIGLEHPELRVKLIDLAPGTPADELDAILTELDDAGLEDLIALRGDLRLVARLVREDLPRPPAPLAFRPDATYLITGGLGGVGLQVARWLVDRGARHLLLVGRNGLSRGPWTPGDLEWQRRRAVERLTAAGADVTVAAVDVADADAVAALLATIPADRPLRGVFHAAGTTDPAPLMDTTAAALRGLYRPKVGGGWVLHRLTRALPLDHFVGFSSAAATWGAALLGPYSAANHFLDVLAHHRRALGLPGLAVNWGGWSGGGMASVDVQRYAADMGLVMAPAAHFLEALDLFLQTGTVQATIGPIRWRTFKAVLEARGPRPLLEHIDPGPDERTGDGSAAQWIAAAPADARWERVLAHVREQVAAVLGFDDPLALDLGAGFFQLGMDSVMSVRLRGDLEVSLGCTLPPTLAFERPSVGELAAWLAREVLGVAVPAPEAPAAPALEDMSEEQLAALLAAELDLP